MNQWNRGQGQKREKAEEEWASSNMNCKKKRHCLAVYILRKSKSKYTIHVLQNYIRHCFRDAHLSDSQQKAVWKKSETAPVCLNHRFRSNMFERDHHHQGPLKNSTAKVTELHETEIMGQIWLNDRPFQSLKFPPQEIRK